MNPHPFALRPGMLCAALLSALSSADAETVGPMVGQVTATEARLLYRPGTVERDLRIDILNAQGAVTATASATSAAAADYVAKFHATGLAPDTRYTYRLLDVTGGGSTLLAGNDGTCGFRTPLPRGQAGVVTLAAISCADATSETVWERMAGMNLDGLLLGGDTPYVDTSVLATVRQIHQIFLSRPRMAALLRKTPTLSTWDDHDFAWNGSCGAGTDRKNAVPQEKRRISKNLFLQFKHQVQQKPIALAYPQQRPLDDLLTDNDTGIQESFDYGPVRIIMLDGRTYREDPSDDKDDDEMPTRSLLGKAQRTWLESQLKAGNDLKLLCSGSTLTRSGESWDHYMDYQWLIDKGFKKTIVLSGDIHKNATQLHGANLFEVTSSGAALPRIGGGSGNFGILEPEGGQVKITLYEKDGLDKTKMLPI